MSGSVRLPVWLVALLGLLAAWAVLDRLLVPSVRWYLRRRANAAIAEANTRIALPLPPSHRPHTRPPPPHPAPSPPAGATPRRCSRPWTSTPANRGLPARSSSPGSKATHGKSYRRSTLISTSASDIGCRGG